MPLTKLASDKCSQIPDHQVGAVCTLAVVSAASMYIVRKWKKEEWTYKFVEKLEDEDVGIATDHLEEGYGNIMPMELNAATDSEEIAPTSRRGVAILNHIPIDTTQHRRVRPGRKMYYLNCVLAECKNKFGTPQQNEANVKAVQRYANNIMSKHGLRPTHVREYLPMIVSMTFVPTTAELEALEMLNSTAATHKKINFLVERTIGGLIPGC